MDLYGLRFPGEFGQKPHGGLGALYSGAVFHIFLHRVRGTVMKFYKKTVLILLAAVSVPLAPTPADAGIFGCFKKRRCQSTQREPCTPWFAMCDDPSNPACYCRQYRDCGWPGNSHREYRGANCHRREPADQSPLSPRQKAFVHPLGYPMKCSIPPFSA